MVSTSKIVVRYAETDQMGVVHHATYPIWYEVARTDYIKKIGISYSQMEKLGVMTPVVELTSHYKRSCYYEDELTIAVWVKTLTAARVEFAYEVYREGETTPVNTGTTLHAWVGTKDFRPLNMKKKYPELYQAMLDLMESK